MELVLSTKGSIDHWIDASESALDMANFYDIQWDEESQRLYANFAKSDYIEIRFSIQEDNRIRLDIKASREQMTSLYQEAVKSEIRRARAASRRETQTPHVKNSSTPHYAERISKNKSNPEHVPHWNQADNTVSEETSQERIFPDLGLSKFQLPAFFEKTWLIILCLIIIPPFGIFLLYYFHKFSLKGRIIMTIVGVIYTLFVWVGFFGVNTGIDGNTFSTFIDTKRSEITRMIEEFKQDRTSPTPTPSTMVVPDANEDVSGGEATY